jgi:hypothetical protein
MEKRRVVITGLGTVNPLGNNTADSWAAAKAGKCGIGPITQFDTTDFKCKLAVEEATETIDGTLHHGDTFFGGGDDEVELLVLYFKVACTTTVNQCLHLRAHGVEVYGSCHDDDVGGNHLFHHFGGIVLLWAGFAVHAAYATSRAVVDVLVFQENLFYLMSGFCGTAHEFVTQEVGVSIPAGTGGED